MNEPLVGQTISADCLSDYLPVNGFDDIIVNKNGTIVDKSSLTVLFRTEPPKSGRNNYRAFTRNNRVKYHHQIVLETFNPDPTSGIIRRVPNHLNGIRWDNRLENLEWATDSDNMKHAYRELGYVGKPPIPMGNVRLKDILTGEIIELESLNAIGRYLNISVSTAKKYLNGSRNKPLAFKYDVATDSHDFVGFTSSDVGKMSFNTFGVYAVSEFGDYRLYIKDRKLAAKLVGMAVPALNKQISLHGLLWRAGWVIVPVDPLTLPENIDSFELVETEDDLPKLALKVVFENGRTRKFSSIDEAAWYFRLSPSNMALQISKRGKKDYFPNATFQWVTMG
ncbi:hypothetical protein ZJ62_24595 [Salmonella enterica subsp. enterica serovar Kentucky]|nr:hypothetical protein [Salmonella enterica subsp. enterica serovar Kentucky]